MAAPVSTRAEKPGFLQKLMLEIFDLGLRNPVSGLVQDLRSETK